VRGGRIKGSLFASDRDLDKAFASNGTEAFALAASHRQSKNKHALCGLCDSAVNKRFAIVFLKKTI
jgi:hypothetical protein